MTRPHHSEQLLRELAELRAENARLRRLLDLRGPTAPAPEQPTTGAAAARGPITMASPPADKLELFTTLFRARTDVYSRHWSNPRTGKQGWVPATRTWYRKGTALLDQDLIPLTHDVVAAHLSGEERIGIYPLLPGDVCHWLAADFDGPEALPDALAYLKAARARTIPAALELSHSGRGAHVWIFFSGPVPAEQARTIGLSLVHEAITLRGSMSLRAYDRLFPSQDAAPSGGVGNFIAAPLQGKARKGPHTTLFLNLATLEPWEDQWEYLSTLDKLTPAQAGRLAREARIVVGHEVGRLQRSRATAIHPRLPATIRVERAAGITVAAGDMTAELAGTLRHAATIHNPQFYELQRLHRSTYDTPRFLQGFDVTPSGDLVLPRALFPLLQAIVSDAGSHLDVTDLRDTGAEVETAFAAQLTGPQQQAVGVMLEHDDGILVAPPGSGKTVMACAMIAERAVSTLVLVDKKALADQWRTRIAELLGVGAGQLGGGRTRTTGVVDIAMLPTLARRDNVAQVARGYGQVIVDECHHLGAGAYEHSVKQMAAAWWLGLTATPARRDGLEDLVTWQLGPVRHVFAAPTAQPTLLVPDAGPRPVLTVHPTRFEFAGEFDVTQPGALAEVHRALVADAARNGQIVADVLGALARGRRCLVLTRRTAHLEALAGLLEAAAHPPLILRGGITAAQRRAVVQELADLPDGAPIVVLGTTPYVGEGFDAPALDTLFLAAPISFPGVLIQAAGRVLRAYPGKDVAEVHDYHDELVPVLAASLARRSPGYRALGFTG